MKQNIKKHSLVLFLLNVFLVSSGFSQNSTGKFPLLKIGINIEKPESYFLLTDEMVIKRQLNHFEKVFDSIQLIKGIKFIKAYPNCQIITNSLNPLENITFYKYDDFNFGNKDSTEVARFTQKNKSELLERIEKGLKYPSKENIERKIIDQDSGICSIGKYLSYLIECKTLSTKFYRELFLINARNSTITIGFQSVLKKSNKLFLKTIEYSFNSDYEYLIEEIKYLKSRSEFDKSKIKINEAIKLEPKNIQAYLLRAENNFILNNSEELSVDSKIILEIDSSNINGYIYQGLAFKRQELFTKAIISFQKAITKYFNLLNKNEANEYVNSLANVYGEIGECYSFGLNDSFSSLYYFNNSIKFSSDSLTKAISYYNLGLVKSNSLKSPKEAIPMYLLAIENYPKTELKLVSEAYFNLALNKRALNDFSGAILDYNQAISIRPDYLKAYNSRAFAEAKLGKYSEAIKDYQTVIQYDQYKTGISKNAILNLILIKIEHSQNPCSEIKKGIELGYDDVIMHYSNYCK